MKFTARATLNAEGVWDISGETEEPNPDPLPLAALGSWLRAIDPKELERVAIERTTGLGSGSVAEDMLSVLADWAEGAT